MSNKPAQPHQKRSIIGGEWVKYFEFGIAEFKLKRTPEVNASVIALALVRLEDLGEALLDFKEINDLINWLETN